MIHVKYLRSLRFFRLYHAMEIAMPEDQASKKRRQRHFWSWVTGTKKLPKNEVSKDFKKLNNLRSQHAKLFPQYYEASKSFSIKEGIRSRSVFNTFGVELNSTEAFQKAYVQQWPSEG